MIRNLIRYGALAAAISLGACEDALVVQNPNQPETDRVLATPTDAEALLGGYYKRWHSGLYGQQGGGIDGIVSIMSQANYSSLANNCQNSRAPFSGASNGNSPGNVCGGDQFGLYSRNAEVMRVASSFLTSMNGAPAGTFFLGAANRDNRARSFAEFLRGVSLGYLAMYYDSSAVITAGMADVDAGALVSYSVVAESAYVALQRAIDAAAATGGFTDVDQAWLPSGSTLNAANFTRLIRSYRARFRAGVARNPAERQAVDWAAVIADAQNGITANHNNITSSTAGPFGGWRHRYMSFGLWHQMPPFIIGQGDVSGNYATWISTPLGDRGAGNASFLMVTPDLRFPQGGTRSAQQGDHPLSNCTSQAQVCKRYFVNRDGGADQFAGLGWGWSNYDFARFHWWSVAGDAGTGQNGTLPFFTLAELNMLEAEGHMRLAAPDYAAAAALINKTRVPNGLSQITVFDNTTPMSDCVPRHTTVAAPTTLTCGTMLEAMKWEKRIETLYTHFGSWFSDARGWGDFPRETAIFWAVPFQDLLARGYPVASIYGAGLGTGNAPNSFTTAVGTYGW